MNPSSSQSGFARYSLIIVSALIAVGPFSMEAYLPAMPTIAEELGVSIVMVNYSISTFFVGAAIGELVGGSISDQIGRRNNVMIGMAVFCLASIGIMFSHDITSIQLLRLLQALGSGFATVVGMPAIRDMLDPKTAARKMPIVTAVMMVTPMLAPVIGSLLMQWSWRVIFAFLALYGLVVLVFFVTMVKAREGQWRTLSLYGVVRQYAKVFGYRFQGRPVACYFVLMQGFVSGVFLTFLTNASWIYIGYFKVSEFQFPLFFAIHTGALMAANLFISRLMASFDARRLIRIGVLLQLLALATLDLLSLQGVSIYLFVLLMILVFWGTALMNASIRAMLFAYFDFLTGSITSVLALARYTFGAALGVVSGLLFDGTLVPIVTMMLLSSLAAFGLEFVLPKASLHEVASSEREQGI